MWWLFLGLILAGCSASQAGAPARPQAPHPAPAIRADSSKALAGDLSLVSIPAVEDSFGPYRAVSGDQVVLLWASTHDDGLVWSSVITDKLGVPRGQVRDLKRTTEEVGLVRLRPLGARRGSMALFSAVDDGEITVETLVLGARGELQGGQVLARPQGDVVWVDVFPQAKGSVALWAVQSPSGAADLFAVALNDRGEPLATPGRVFQDANAWQGQRLGDGVALALVAPSQAGEPQGAVQLLYLNPAAQINATLQLSESPTAEADIDMALIGEHLICAWSDVKTLPVHVEMAIADTAGRLVAPPAAAVKGVHGQALARIVANEGAKQGYMLWEDLAPEPGPQRDFLLASVDATGQLSKQRTRVHFSAAQGGVPELQAAVNGGALLTQGACAGCEDGANTPQFVRFDNDLKVNSAGPVQVVSAAGRMQPALVWAPACAYNECSALAAMRESPARIFTVPLSSRAAPDPTIAKQVLPPSPPYALESRVMVETEPLAQVAAVETQAGTLLAWLTEFDPDLPYVVPTKPAPDGRMAPVQALLQVQLINPAAAPQPVQTVSYRARSMGGLSVTHNLTKDESLLVWSALDQKQPHVFVTLVDGQGKKVAQRMLTQASGEVYDSAAAFVGDGWLVAWVDARSGQPQAYAAKIDSRLMRKSPDQLLSKAQVSGLSLALQGKDVALLSAEDDSATHSGVISLSYLNPVNAQVVGTPTRVSTGARHAHSAALARAGEALEALWLEDESRDLGAPSQLMVSSLRAGVAGRPQGVTLPAGVQSVSRASLVCDPGGCRLAAVARAEGQRVVLLAGKIPATQGRTSPMQVLTQLHPQGVPSGPAVSGSAIFLADTSPSGRGLARRLLVEW